jgi:hypothetical protein
VLYATGRVPNTAGLGLEALGVALNDRGGVLVDEHYRSSVPNIYAIGDVIDGEQLTPVAIAEGMCIANNLFTDNAPRTVDYALIPTAVFCQPNIGTVGLTEAQARERFGDIDVYATDFKPHEAHAVRARRAHADEAGGEPCRPAGGRRAHGRRRGRRDHSGPGGGHDRRGHQGGLRPHHRHPSHGGGGVRHHAATQERLMSRPARITLRPALGIARAAALPACLTIGGAAPAAQGPRNVILFLGDGMGVSTVTAARILPASSRAVRVRSTSCRSSVFPTSRW